MASNSNSGLQLEVFKIRDKAFQAESDQRINDVLWIRVSNENIYRTKQRMQVLEFIS